MTYLVDSDYVADYLKGQATTLPLFHQFVSQGITISIITFAEVYEGIYYGHNRSKYEQGWRLFLKTTPVLGISRTLAKRYALIRGELARKGNLIYLLLPLLFITTLL